MRGQANSINLSSRTYLLKASFTSDDNWDFSDSEFRLVTMLVSETALLFVHINKLINGEL